MRTCTYKTKQHKGLLGYTDGHIYNFTTVKKGALLIYRVYRNHFDYSQYIEGMFNLYFSEVTSGDHRRSTGNTVA